MAAPTVSDIRAGLATNLATLAGIQESAYMLSAPTPPYVEVFPDRVDYDSTMGRGFDRWTFIVRAFVGSPTDKGSQKTLDAMLNPDGAASIKKAVETDRTLAGKVASLAVTNATGYRIYNIAGKPALGCEWEVEILAAGK